MNTKVIKGFTPEWQQILQPTLVYSLGRDEASSVTSVENLSTALNYYTRKQTTDKLYLPALVEIDPDISDNTSSPDAINRYHDDKGPNKDNLSSYPQFVDTNSSRIRKIKGTDTSSAWWTRTPNLNSPRNWKAVTPEGKNTETGYIPEGGSSSQQIFFYPWNKAGILLAFSI